MTKIELLPSNSTVALIEEPTQVADPWDLPELRDTGIKWSGKSRQEGLPSVRVGFTISIVSSPLCWPLSCPCSDALQTKVLARDATWQSWRLQFQAQCEDQGAFCSPSLSECPSVGTLVTVLLPMIHCGPTGSQERCSGCSSEQTGSLTESSWIGGGSPPKCGHQGRLAEDACIDYTTSKAGMQANAAFLSWVQGVGSVCSSDSWERGNENRCKKEQRK